MYVCSLFRIIIDVKAKILGVSPLFGAFFRSIEKSLLGLQAQKLDFDSASIESL
jgi:hypothetical protein